MKLSNRLLPPLLSLIVIGILRDGRVAVVLDRLLVGANGWNLLSAEGINDRGPIVGYGSFEGGPRASLPTPSAAPEPSSVAIVPLGGVAGAWYARRSQTRRGRS